MQENTELEIQEKVYVARVRGVKDVVSLAWKLRNPERVASQKRKYRLKYRERDMARRYANKPKRQLYEKNRTRSRSYRKEMNLIWAYGMQKSEFNDLRIKQHNCCAICRERFSEMPHVDHDHLSGATRGLLCRSCNIGIGHLKDSIKLARAALQYLEFHGVSP